MISLADRYSLVCTHQILPVALLQVVKQFLDFSVDEDIPGSEVNNDPSQVEPASPESSSSLKPLIPETPDPGARVMDASTVIPESQYTPGKNDQQAHHVLSPNVTSSIGVQLTDFEATFSSDHPSKLELSSVSEAKNAITKSMIESMDSSLTAASQTHHIDSRESSKRGNASAPLTEDFDQGKPDSPVSLNSFENPEDMNTTLCMQEPAASVETSITVDEANDNRDHPVGETESNISNNQDNNFIVNSPKAKIQTPDQEYKVQENKLSIPNTPPANTSLKESFAGFMTAGGKKVEVSQEALAAVRLKFSNQDEEAEHTPRDGFPGLQTASGKKVEVSKKALTAARATLEENGSKQTQHVLSPQAARAKTVEISKQLLEAPRHSSFPGLQTASGKTVPISKRSLEAAKAVLDTTQSFPGLQTASGQEVSVSAAKAVLDSPHTQPLSNSQTTSVKEITVSAHSVQGIKATPRSSGSKLFSGLQMASGQKVSISAKHLEAAKASLDDDLPSNRSSQEVKSKTAMLESLEDTSETHSFQPLLKNVRTVGQSSALPETTPTTKYKPIFKSGRQQAGGGRTALFGQPQRRLGTSKRGVITTPEGYSIV